LYEFFAVVVGFHVAVFTPCTHPAVNLIRKVHVHLGLTTPGTGVIRDLLHLDSLDNETLVTSSNLRDEPKSKTAPISPDPA